MYCNYEECDVDMLLEGLDDARFTLTRSDGGVLPQKKGRGSASET